MHMRTTLHIAFGALVILGVVAISSCGGDGPSGGQEGRVMSNSTVTEVLESHTSFEEEWTLIRTISPQQTDRVLIAQPRSILLGPDGIVVIGDSSESDVKIYDASGALIRRFGGPGDGPGEFRQLAIMAWGNDDTIVILDSVLRRIQTFSLDGQLIATLPLEGIPSPLGVLPLSDDRFVIVSGGIPTGAYMQDPMPDVLYWIDSAGTLLESTLALASTLPRGVTEPDDMWMAMRHVWGTRVGDSILVAHTLRPDVWIVSAEGGPVEIGEAFRRIENPRYRSPRPPMRLEDFQTGQEVLQWLQENADWMAQPVAVGREVLLQVRKDTRLLASESVDVLSLQLGDSHAHLYVGAPPLVAARGDSLVALIDHRVESFALGVFVKSSSVYDQP